MDLIEDSVHRAIVNLLARFGDPVDLLPSVIGQRLLWLPASELMALDSIGGELSAYSCSSAHYRNMA